MKSILVVMMITVILMSGGVSAQKDITSNEATSQAREFPICHIKGFIVEDAKVLSPYAGGDTSTYILLNKKGDWSQFAAKVMSESTGTVSRKSNMVMVTRKTNTKRISLMIVNGNLLSEKVETVKPSQANYGIIKVLLSIN
jgi:hypothetical protein